MITYVGFPVTLVFILLFLNYLQNKRYTKALDNNTAAISSLEKAVVIISERVK
jgi:hypothetical protein